jgi:hypothetical protein
MPPLQMLGEQGCVDGVTQAPLPLQVDLGWTLKVSAQEAAMHWIPMVPCVQAPFVHVPVLPQGGLSLGHIPCNSVAPLPRFAHEPDAQVWQVPQIDELQQMPSTQ